MTSYWKLINMVDGDLVAVGKEKPLYDLKMLYENKMNTPTKMVKCFGKEDYHKNLDYMKKKSLKILNDINEHNF
jgi:hypothetical protein